MHLHKSGGRVQFGTARKNFKQVRIVHNNLYYIQLIIYIAIETLGVIGPKSMAFLKDLSRRIKKRTGELNARSYLVQRFSMDIQKGNAISVLGSMRDYSGSDHFSL